MFQAEVGQLQGQLQAEVKRLQGQVQQARSEEEEAQEQRHALKLQLTKVGIYNLTMSLRRDRKVKHSHFWSLLFHASTPCSVLLLQGIWEFLFCFSSVYFYHFYCSGAAGEGAHESDCA